MSRYKAAAIHLLFSAAILTTVFFLIAYVWYPQKMFALASGAQLMHLIIGVDLVIGPLVMLIIFDAKKKLIKMDVAIIVICQIVFMGYGLWSMFVSRPVFLVFAENHFYLIRANEIEQKDLDEATNLKFDHLPLLGPIEVGTKLPDNREIQQQLLFAGLMGMGIQNFPQYFVPYEEVTKDVIKAGKTVQQLGVESEAKQRVIEYEKKAGQHGLYLPMVNKTTPLVVVIDATTARIIDVI